MLSAKKFLGLGLSLLAFSTACADDEQPVSATLPYQIGAGLSCQQSKVTTLRAVLGAAREQVFEGPCDDTGKLAVNGVRKGTWPLVLEGVDAQGAVIMRSTIGAAAVPRVELLADGATLPRLTLANVPAKMQLRWNLGFGSCETLNIKGFMVQAWDQSKGRMLMSGTIECGAPVVNDTFRALPDPQGLLSGSELRALSIQPLLVNGQGFGDAVQVDLQSPPGPGYIVRVSLTCDADAKTCASTPAAVQITSQ